MPVHFLLMLSISTPLEIQHSFTQLSPKLSVVNRMAEPRAVKPSRVMEWTSVPGVAAWQIGDRSEDR
jgi:hypothetical protein